MLPAPRPCGGAAAPAGWLSPGGITKSAPVPRFRRPKHSSFCRVIVAARARSTSLQLPILDCRLYFTGQHRKNQYFFAGPHNFFAATRVFAPPGNVPRPRARFFRCTPLLALVGAGVPDGPLLVLSPKGYFALRRDSLLPTAAKGCKNAAKNQWFLEFLSPDCSCGAKRFRSESPLRLPSLPLTWHAESNGRPPPPGNVPRPRPRFFRCPPSRTRRGRRPRRPVLLSAMLPVRGVPRPRARVTFGRSPKSDQKRCLKPQVSRLPARLGMV